jgi:adenylylsulfate reductase subunit A
MWFLLFKAVLKNAYGERVSERWAQALEEWAPYGSAEPIPTPLRNHQMVLDCLAGRGPHYLRTDEALQRLFAAVQYDPERVRQIEAEVWEDFLDMTIPQAHVWAAENIDPAKVPSEVALTEPYLMGSHASATGAWVSGPEDLAPEEYFWGYNRMTTIRGLFAAGDGVGGSAHKFSSGSHTEGRLAAKAAVAYVHDNPDPSNIDLDRIAAIRNEIWRPVAQFEKAAGTSTRSDVNPNYILPKDALLRLQKIMDEYGAGCGAHYTTNEPTLARGLALLDVLRADLDRMAARDLHDLLRCWEVRDRFWCAEAHLRHILFRKETRWPGYYYRADYPRLDDQNWRCFVNSRYDAAKDQWLLTTRPYIPLLE